MQIEVRIDGVGGNEQWEDNQAFDVTDKWKSDGKMGSEAGPLYMLLDRIDI